MTAKTKTAPQKASQQPADRIDLASPPAWMHPQTLRDLATAVASRGAIVWQWQFSKGERAVLRHRKAIPVSLWAERHRVVHNSSRPGRWHNMTTPYAAGIMDVSLAPSVQQVAIMKCPQSAGTESVHNCVAYTLDRAPGPVLYVYPDETTARENCQDRIIPMIMASPRLREYLTGMADDLGSLRVNLAHTTIYMAWSGSASRLGNKPIRYLVLDELDKYQGSKKEASAEALAEKRTITWGKRAVTWKLSTPTVVDGPIDAAFKTAEARFRYHVACPHCGTEHLMEFDSIRWPDSVQDPVQIKSHQLGWYECPHCAAHWTDADRDLAVRRGAWREEVSNAGLAEYVEKNRPISVAFHIPAWISPFVSLSEIAAKAHEYALAPSVDVLKDLQNNYKAEPWQQEHEERSEDQLLLLADDRPRGAVPGPVDGRPRVACLLAGVDTQGSSESRGYFRYVIRAFGYGDAEESWLVQAGAAPNFNALHELLFKSVYRDANGQEYMVKGVMIDAMGARTREVYAWAVRNRGRVFPWQGVRSMTTPYTPTALEYYPSNKGTKVKIPGGLNLWRCDVTFFKNDLAAKLAIAPTDPGAFHLHTNEGGQLLQYAKEMCAEVYDTRTNAWENPKNKANHFWDCEVMARALAYILNVRHVQAPRAEKQPDNAPRGQAAPPKQRPGGSATRPTPGGRAVTDRLANIRRG